MPCSTRLRLSGELIHEVEEVLEPQLEYHLDRRLKTLEFIGASADGYRTEDPPPRPPRKGGGRRPRLRRKGGGRMAPPPAKGEGDGPASRARGREMMEKLVSLGKRRGFFLPVERDLRGIQGSMTSGRWGGARNNISRRGGAQMASCATTWSASTPAF